jgi:cytochrome c oxidase subunit 2
MIGEVIVMTPQDYEAWLGGGASSEAPAVAGERFFNEYACSSCHKNDASGRGPALAGVFGGSVKLADGRTITADDNYLRESIMMAPVKIVAGYQPVMPVFQGQISEERVMQIIAYIKTLKASPATAAAH